MTEKERVEKFEHIMLLAGLTKDKIKDITNRLYKFGYFDAPASIKHHGNYEGGLFDHSLAVTYELVRLTNKLDLKWFRKESPYIVGMFHDLCKCQTYKKNNETHCWEYNQNTLMTGHGELSVILAQCCLNLTSEEILCIRWHMGAYDDKENWDKLGRAIEYCLNVLYTHTADMIASKIKGI